MCPVLTSSLVFVYSILCCFVFHCACFDLPFPQLKNMNCKYCFFFKVNYRLIAEWFHVIPQGGASPLLYWEEMRGSLPQPTPPASPKATTKPITVLPANDPAPAPIPAPAKPSEDSYKPKLCKLEKTSSGYGFHLNGIMGQTGQYFIKEVRTHIIRAKKTFRFCISPILFASLFCVKLHVNYPSEKMRIEFIWPTCIDQLKYVKMYNKGQIK